MMEELALRFLFAPQPANAVAAGTVVTLVTEVPPLATGSVPVTPAPAVNGRPVAFVKVADAGVPRTGVTSVGEVAKTTPPEPVDDDVLPVPPLPVGSVPVTAAL